MPRAFCGEELAIGRDDEAWLVFATNANVPEDGEGHHAVEKAANLQWVGESVASERIPSM